MSSCCFPGPSGHLPEPWMPTPTPQPLRGLLKVCRVVQAPALPQTGLHTIKEGRSKAIRDISAGAAICSHLAPPWPANRGQGCSLVSGHVAKCSFLPLNMAFSPGAVPDLPAVTAKLLLSHVGIKTVEPRPKLWHRLLQQCAEKAACGGRLDGCGTALGDAGTSMPAAGPRVALEHAHEESWGCLEGPATNVTSPPSHTSNLISDDQEEASLLRPCPSKIPIVWSLGDLVPPPCLPL